MERDYSWPTIQNKRNLFYFSLTEISFFWFLTFKKYTPIRMAKIQSTDNTKCWRGCRVTGTWIHCWWECKTVTLEDSLAVSYKTKHTITKTNILLLGIYPQKLKIYVHTKTCTQTFIRNFILNCQNLEATKMPFSRSMDKLWYIQMMEYYSALKEMS